jgi:hypothetical protein
VTSPHAKRRAERSYRYRQNARNLSRIRSSDGLGQCPGCGKRAFTSKEAAKAAARSLYPEVKMRVYQCHDTDFWHYTSQDAAQTERERLIWAGVRDAEAAAAWVGQVVDATGTGPTWSELAAAMGWPSDRAIIKAIICTLAKRGWLTTGRRSRSLRPGPLAASREIA